MGYQSAGVIERKKPECLLKWLLYTRYTMQFVSTHLCGVRGLGGPRAQHVVDGLHDLGHLLLVDDAVAIDVVHPVGGRRTP